jgi:hypothetical protein
VVLIFPDGLVGLTRRLTIGSIRKTLGLGKSQAASEGVQP